MRCFVSTVALAIAASASAVAQNVPELIARASQPVTVELAFGVDAPGRPLEQLARAGLGEAVPARVAVLSISAPEALQDRADAERALGAMGSSIISDLIAAESAQPVGLFIPATGTTGNRVRAQVRGLNIEGVFAAMGSGALDSLSSVSNSDSPVSGRASQLLNELGDVEIEISSGNRVRLDGEPLTIDELPSALAGRPLARTAIVIAPGDLPVNQVVPVIDAVRRAGLALDMAATSSAVVTISQGQEED